MLTNKTKATVTYQNGTSTTFTTRDIVARFAEPAMQWRIAGMDEQGRTHCDAGMVLAYLEEVPEGRDSF